jgi:hypothetical protein
MWHNRQIMLSTLRQLVELARLPHRRAEELSDLRRRLAAQPPPSRVGPLEAQLAARLRLLREAVSAATGEVTACTACARGSEPPNGRWDGGFCCGGSTSDLFSDDELAALRLAGTRPDDLRCPGYDLAGCVFRGPHGCALDPGHRPTQCVSHICQDLLYELHSRGRLEAVEDLRQELDATFRDFVEVRTARIDDQLVGLARGR